MDYTTIQNVTYSTFSHPDTTNIAGSKAFYYSDPRAIACKITYEYFINRQKKYTLKELADIYGFKQHSGVIHAIRKANRLIETDKTIRLLYNRIRIKLLTFEKPKNKIPYNELDAE